jgi:hypothetical protein
VCLPDWTFGQPERRQLENRSFQPVEYVYERTKSAIEHCRERMEAHGSAWKRMEALGSRQR